MINTTIILIVTSNAKVHSTLTGQLAHTYDTSFVLLRYITKTYVLTC